MSEMKWQEIAVGKQQEEYGKGSGEHKGIVHSLMLIDNFR